MKIEKMSLGQKIKILAHVLLVLEIVAIMLSQPLGDLIGGIMYVPIALIPWLTIYSFGELLDNQHKQLVIMEEMVRHQRESEGKLK